MVMCEVDMKQVQRFGQNLVLNLDFVFLEVLLFKQEVREILEKYVDFKNQFIE